MKKFFSNKLQLNLIVTILVSFHSNNEYRKRRRKKNGQWCGFKLLNI